MLHLVRQVGDKGIVIELPNGQLLEISIEKIWNKKVSIGFKNEQNLKVWRGELYDRMQENNA